MSPPLQWIEDLVSETCRTITLIDANAPVGCHHCLAGDVHEISIFVSSTEIVGGPYDGKQIAARFIVDVIELLKILDAVDSFTWQPQTVDETDDVGANLAVSGVYEGNLVWIRILSETPSRFLPGRIYETSDDHTLNAWDE